MIPKNRKRGSAGAGLFFSAMAALFIGSPVVAGGQMISSLSPSSGTAGTAVTLNGSGFGKRQGSSIVTFNGTPAVAIGWIDSEVTAIVPDGATSGPVVVTVNGESSDDDHSFRVIVPASPPSISSLSPASSRLTSDATGTAVTIKGWGFGPIRGTGRVAFNGVPASVIDWSDAEIRAALPEGATTGPVVVTVHDEPSNGLPFTVYPYIASLTPSGQGGSVLMIEGSHFGSGRGTGSVTIDGIPAPIIRWNDTGVVVAVPGGAGGPVAVTVNGVQSNTDKIFAFTPVIHPAISSLFPRSGPPETSVILTGSGFGRRRDSGAVAFNGASAAVLSWSDTQIIAFVPAEATAGPVVVSVKEVLSDPAPIFKVDSVSPFSLNAITLAPEHLTLAVGRTGSFTATGRFNDGSSQPLTPATLAAGIGHTCAVLSEGKIRCWGENTFGQLGDGSDRFALVPAPMRGIGSATAVAAGRAHTCALLSEGRVDCWGDNSVGQLGNGTNIGSALPVEVAGISRAVAISAEGNRTCALLEDGTSGCWGGEGRGSWETAADSVPDQAGGFGGTPVAAGGGHTCALLSKGRVNCWGDNTFGQLGNGGPSNSSMPVRVDDLDHAAAIAAGLYHTCAVLSDGTIGCWGAGHFGRLGDGKNTSSGRPVTVQGISGAAALLWSSSNPEVATIDPNGRVTALRPGLTTISATSRGVSGSTTLLVEPSDRPAAVSSSAGPALVAMDSGN